MVISEYLVSFFLFLISFYIFYIESETLKKLTISAKKGGFYEVS